MRLSLLPPTTFLPTHAHAQPHMPAMSAADTKWHQRLFGGRRSGEQHDGSRDAQPPAAAAAGQAAFISPATQAAAPAPAATPAAASAATPAATSAAAPTAPAAGTPADAALHVFHLRNGGTSVVVDAATATLPSIIYWGADLGGLSSAELNDLANAAVPQRVSGGLDVIPRLTLVPQESNAWQGTPGIAGHQLGSGHWSAALRTKSLSVKNSTASITAVDTEIGLSLSISLEVTAEGLFTQELSVSNTAKSSYQLQHLAATFPVPETANELLDTYGRHLRERHPQRHAFTVGKHERESRRGRPGADATLLQVVGAKGFGFERGIVHAVHLAWSGNHRVIAEKGPSYPPFLQVCDLLLPGEGLLQPGETYTTPKAIGSWGDGMAAMSHRFHAYVRALPGYPKSTRPVVLNTWEAVHFDLNVDKLVELAKTAAAAGAERFVLDDGWFKGRRNDTIGLGDWFVDKTVFPKGLQPLWDAVDKAGLQCGLWFEPEMVNLDSDVARAHPDWILRPTADRLPVPGRQQYVLDMSNPDCFAYIFKCIDDILTEYPLIKYIKWDHNRDLVEPSSALAGYRAAVRANVLSVYRLMDKLKKAHAGLEIESCASGGARVDLGILERTDRIWTSDNTDARERLPIQKYTSLVVPQELMGAHIGPPECSLTGRLQKLDFRAGVALLCHFGIEWDLTTASADEQADVKRWVDLFKKWRDVIHTGDLVHVENPADEGTDVRGVVAKDKSRAIFTFTQLNTPSTYPPPKFRLCGLDPGKKYKVTTLFDLLPNAAVGQSPLQWAGGVTLSGQALDAGVLATLVIEPERLFVLEVVEAQSSG